MLTRSALDTSFHENQHNSYVLTCACIHQPRTRLNMKITGQCHCGAITYEAELDPESVGICHCTDCQSLSASAFRTVGIVKPGDFTLLSGQPKIYIKTGSSGNPREQAFCDNCGSALYAAGVEDEPKVKNLRLGTVNERAELRPHFQVWCASALPWLPQIDTLVRSPRQG